MKILRAFFCLIMLMGLLAFPMTVLAHVEASNNGISAEMHLPPYDSAVAGRAQRIEFIFEDEPSTFSLKDCDCSLKIAPREGKATTISTQLDTQVPDQLTSQTTFNDAGDYTLTLTGYTNSTRAQKFNLAYSLHVQPAPHHVSAAAKKSAIFLIGLCIVAAVVVLVYYNRPNRKLPRD
jgi:hypothetical protein